MNEISPAALRVKKEAPAYARCSQRVVEAAVRSGELPTLKLGQNRLVRIEALDKWMKKQERAGVPAAVTKAHLSRLGRK